MKVEAIVTDRVVQLCLVDGMQTHRVDAGSRQNFILNGETYIKFDNPANLGFYQTLRELELLRKIQERHRHYFVLPLQYGVINGLSFTVVPRVYPSEIIKPTKYDVQELGKVLEAYEISDVEGYVGNSVGYNCVFTDIGWKIYDYGFSD